MISDSLDYTGGAIADNPCTRDAWIDLHFGICLVTEGLWSGHTVSSYKMEQLSVSSPHCAQGDRSSFAEDRQMSESSPLLKRRLSEIERRQLKESDAQLSFKELVLDELPHFWRLSLPVVVAYLLEYLPGTMGIILVGHMPKSDLSKE